MKPTSTIKGLVLCLLLTACVTSPKEPSHTYLLDVVVSNSYPPSTTGKTLLVSHPQAAPGFDTPALIYIRTPHVLEQYSQSRWVDTPAHMLLPLLIRILESTGQFSAVLSANTSSVVGELRLDTEIVRLQQEFFTKPSQVRFILRAQLLNMAERNVLATKVFEVVEPAPTEDATGGMLAANHAVAKVMTEMASFLIEHLPSH